MGNLRKLATFKPKLAKIIILNYFKSTFKVKLTNNITLDRKSKESVTSKLFFNRKSKNHYFNFKSTVKVKLAEMITLDRKS